MAKAPLDGLDQAQRKLVHSFWDTLIKDQQTRNVLCVSPAGQKQFSKPILLSHTDRRDYPKILIKY